MMWCVIVFLFCVSSSSAFLIKSENNKEEFDGETVHMIDAMMQIMEGGGEFDRAFFTKLQTCMDTLSPELRQVSDGAWTGMVTYHATNGTGDDTWGSILNTTDCPAYHEQNLTLQEYKNIGIYEPCNYASNLAYYHVVTMVCEHTEWNLPKDYQLAIAQTFTALTVGSAFWHGSRTALGVMADNRFIDVIRAGTANV